jgi:hypothetical protein
VEKQPEKKLKYWLQIVKASAATIGGILLKLAADQIYYRPAEASTIEILILIVSGLALIILAAVI